MSSLTFKTLTGVILSLMWLGLVSPSWANPTALNYISEIKGDVRLRRSQWNGYRRANIGQLLNPSDQLNLNAGASASVMCNNLSVWTVPAGQVSFVSNGCGASKPPNSRRNNRRTPSRAPNETIPYIISPRNTALLNNRPILRWNAVPGATRYKVRVQDAGLTLNWQTETNNTQIGYLADKPPLQPGYNYSLIVETEQGKSSEKEEGIDLSFTVLDTQEAESVRTELDKLKQLKLTQEAATLGLAYLYQSYDLKAEAIKLLETLLKRGSQLGAVYQLLGDLYLQVGLSQQAKNPYLQAMELAKQTEDIEGQAEAQEGLGEAYYGLNNKEDAVAWLKKAKDNYIVLGEQSKPEELNKRIAEILQ